MSDRHCEVPQGPKQSSKSWITLLILSLLFSPLLFAKTPEPPTSDSLLRMIHTRRGNWIGLKGDLTLEFVNTQGKKISCRGSLVYQRLDEKILLKGFNQKNELLFAFKTSDRNFEVYLPMIGEHAHGNIFDLEDSPDIQSHLRALDLYRALKPGAIPPERMVIVQAKRDPLRIKIKRSKSDNAFSRELLISPKGDVLREIFYSADGKPSTEILRSEFKEIKGVATSKSFFPLRIEIVTELKKTILQFKQLQLLSEVQDSDFELVLPENTRRVTL